MARVLVIEPRERLAQALVKCLGESPVVEACRPAGMEKAAGFGAALENGQAGVLGEQGIDTVVYAPPAGKKVALDLADAEKVFRHCAGAAVRKVIVLSSAAVYGPNPHNTGLVGEGRLTSRQRQNRTAACWLELEALARRHLGKQSGTALVILRPTAVPLPDETAPLGRLFHRGLVFVLAGHDPSVQLLSPEDLARAVRCALESEREDVYNVAPAGVVPLRQALRLAGVKYLPLPYLWQRGGRAVSAGFGRRQAGDETEYIRYSWTVNGNRIADELGFVPLRSSAEALAECCPAAAKWHEPVRRRYDDYGLDERYYALMDRTVARFLDRAYWRTEVRGINQVPAQGPAVLVGIHRGFMPFDGFVTAHQISQATGRIPRFLIHPGLVKFPFLHDFMVKQGTLIACNESADYVLLRQGLLALYPEGINGAFRLYRDAYRLGKFGRDEYVRMALRNRAPIVPFVTLGSAETFPILGKIEWAWWKRYSEWPFLPLTPTFPLLPVPLPSKWHTRFLEPMDVHLRYPPEAAEDNDIVRALGQEVRTRMEKELVDMRARRRSIFLGSIFDEEPAVPVAAGQRSPAQPV